MTSRCIALLLSLALAGCCGSGVGCGTPTAPGGVGVGVAWDGLGPAPVENTASGDNAPTARSRPTATRTRSSVQPGDQWEQEQGLDQAADAKLTRQLKICSSC